ncbi:MAG: hypothetical protein ACXVHC_03770 [Frankiaceae bacterium]
METVLDQVSGAPTARAVERGLIVLGGALMAVCPYLTWVRVILLGGFDLPALLSLTSSSGLPAYLLTAVGVALGLMAALVGRLDVIRLTAIAATSVVLLAGGTMTYQLISAADASHGLAEIGGGLICGAVGAVLALIAPIVGMVKDHVAGTGHTGPIPIWFPVALAVVIVAGLLLSPVRASMTNYCGYPIAAWLRSDRQLPSSTPPSSVTAELDRDQSSVAEAQQALDAEESNNAGVEAEASSANSLQTQAQAAQQQADSVASTVSTDEGLVSSDQGALDGAGGTVDGDKTAVDSDQWAIQQDQNTLASDEQSGWDPSFDQQQLDSDQSRLADDQQTLLHDQDAAQAAQDKLDQDTATLAKDQQSAAAASHGAEALQQQADRAGTAASHDGAAASDAHDQATQSLTDAENQLARDEDSWSSQHESEVAAVTQVNAALASCRDQSQARLFTAAVVAVLAAAAIGALAYPIRRRRRALGG